MTDDKLDGRLLDRYLAGECTPDEDSSVRQWLAADPKRAAAIAATRDALRGPSAAGFDTNGGWQRFADRISADALRSPQRSSRRPSGGPPNRRPLHSWGAPALRMAAVLVVLLSTAFVWWRLADDPIRIALREAVTRKGERASLRLADGTLVTLGVESRLRFDSAMSGLTREVFLSGEALFQVTHRPEQPFIVHAGGTATRVLGTEFSVRAYPTSSRVQVVVASGSVSVGSRAQGAPPTILRRGQVGVVHDDGTATVRDGVNVDHYLAWTTGQLRFDDATLADALPDLERWFDVHFMVSDATLARRPFTLLFRGDSLDPLLDALALALDARTERRGDSIAFIPNRPPSVSR